MFIKKISSGPQNENRPKTEFPLGTIYIQDDRRWTVIEEVKDTDAIWRRVRSNVGDEELLVLETLKRDLVSGDITFTED